MTRSNHSPYKMFQIIENHCQGFFENFEGIKEYTNLPNQNFPASYMPNGYCDMVIKKTVEKNTSTFGNRIFGHETENIIDIDDHFHLDIVKFQIGTKYDRLSVHLNKL
jgi:CMP-N-acetylneuraminic acid synthetase